LQEIGTLPIAIIHAEASSASRDLKIAKGITSWQRPQFMHCIRALDPGLQLASFSFSQSCIIGH
jgi:hypothetical protein